MPSTPVATPVANLEAAAQVPAIYSMKLIMEIMEILSPIRQNYRKKTIIEKIIIIEIPTHFCDHRGHRFFPVTCLLNVAFFFYNSVGDCK